MEASKQAADVGKKNFEDLSYVSKSTLGDLTKTAKEAAVKKGLILMESDQLQSPTMGQKRPQQEPHTTIATNQGNTSSHFFSSLTSDITGLTQSTSSMFSGLFGNKGQQQQQQHQGQMMQQQQQQHQPHKQGGKILGFDPFPSRKGLVERNPLIKHAGPKQTQEDFARQQNAERTSSNSENQAFLNDVRIVHSCNKNSGNISHFYPNYDLFS